MPDWTRHTYRLSLWVATLGLVLVAPIAFAQNVQPAGEPVAAAQPPAPAKGAAQPGDTTAAPAAAKNDTIMDMIQSSGWTGWTFMGMLLLFSIGAAMVALERAVNTQRKKIIPHGFVAELKNLVKNDEADADAFHGLCARWSAPIAKVLNAGLLRCGRPLPEVEKSMEDAASREMATLRGGIRPLNVVGNVAPLVGLLGTVVGMIIAFRTASQAGLGKGEMMAQGIYMALLTTAAGLSIAIPCLLLAAVFSSKVDKFFREIDESMMDTMPSFARMERAEAADVRVL
jgi:biopolymer transport protein ExbB